MEILFIIPLIIIPFTLLFFITKIYRHIITLQKIYKQNVILKEEKDNQLIQKVTCLTRGTASEHHLILTLLQMGISPQAIFHDLYIARNDEKFSQIDLVVATRVGIIVFEVKDFGGWIYGNGNQIKWTQVLAYGNEKYKFYNPIMQNNTHIKQLRHKLKENVPFYSVIVFYGDSLLQDISFIPRGTFVTKWYRVGDVINTILQENSPADYKDKRRVVKLLKEAVAAGDQLNTKVQHIENIKDMLGTDRIFQ